MTLGLIGLLGAGFAVGRTPVAEDHTVEAPVLSPQYAQPVERADRYLLERGETLSEVFERAALAQTDVSGLVLAMREQQARGRYIVFGDAEKVSTSGGGDFLNARRFLTGESRRHLMAEFKSENVGFEALKALPNDVDRKALELIEEYFGQYEEIYLTPLLRKLSEQLGEDELDPKEIVSDLEEVGAGRLEKRRGEPHDYTVLILNPRHPDVVEVRERMREEGSLYSPDEVSYDVADYAEDENGG